jgi:hypothetical protein
MNKISLDVSPAFVSVTPQYAPVLLIILRPSLTRIFLEESMVGQPALTVVSQNISS